MPATLTQAHDEVLEVFDDAWSALATPPPVQYPDRPPPVDPFPPVGATWARVHLTDNEGEQIGFGPAEGRRYRSMGVLTVQIFAPKGSGRSIPQALAQTVLGAFRGKTTAGGLEFFRHRARDIGPDGDWWQTNVIVEYQYDSVE